jgi:hypothetical protein
MKVYVRNEGTATFPLVRASSAPLGPDFKPVWLEVTSDPDLFPWQVARVSAVTVCHVPLVANQSFSFWMRIAVDQRTHEGKAYVQLKLTP